MCAALAHFALAFIQPVFAQSSTPSVDAAAQLEPPRSAAGDRYLERAREAGLQAEIAYLDPDAPLDAEVAPEIESEQDPAPASSLEPVGLAVLFGALVILAVLAFRARHVLAELLLGRDRKLRAAGARGAEGGDGPPLVLDTELLARLRQERDPRVGLRMILSRFLSLAARENGLALRRNLTTREVLRALPGSWTHRGDLERLAHQVELTVFGGREMSRDDYEDCVALAAPLLFKADPA